MHIQIILIHMLVNALVGVMKTVDLSARFKTPLLVVASMAIVHVDVLISHVVVQTPAPTFDFDFFGVGIILKLLVPLYTAMRSKWG